MTTTTYLVETRDRILDATPEAYVLRIRDLPAEDKPREKLLKYGPSVLSTSELIAVLLNVGTTKEGVLGMANRVSREYGEKSLASQTDPKRMAKDLGIPLVKAAQLVACFELGRRFYRRENATAVIIRTPQDVYRYLQDMRNLPKEHLRGIYLNAHHRIVHDEVISIGTVNTNLVHAREVFRPAIAYGAAAVILAHNHPSGVTKPSEADVNITRELRETGNIIGIPLIDHVIITPTRFTSIKVDE